MARPRIVVVGMGDTGILTAAHLARRDIADIIGIGTTPGLVSGQELGLRIAQPERWSRHYLVDHRRFTGLDAVRRVHGAATEVDLTAREVLVADADGGTQSIGYDRLVIATGVSNGWWRSDDIRTLEEARADLDRDHARIAAAARVLVVGGGAAAVTTAYQIALRWPEKSVTLAFPGDRALVRHHPKVWRIAQTRLAAAGVQFLANHRAVLEDSRDLANIGTGPVMWESEVPGHEAVTEADAVIWAIGRVRPHTGWLSADLLDEHGFVQVTPELHHPENPEIYAIGDVAATDPMRASARSRADKLAARNVAASLTGKRLRSFVPPRHRWGSVLGVEPDGLRVFAPTGSAFRFPKWTVDPLLMDLATHRAIYGGVRLPVSSPDN